MLEIINRNIKNTEEYKKMSKFNVGDKVKVLVDEYTPAPKGATGVVARASDGWCEVVLDGGDGFQWYFDNHQLELIIEGKPLRELNVKAGDVVRWVSKGLEFTIDDDSLIVDGELKGEYSLCNEVFGVGIFTNELFTIVSRATAWQDMTDAEQSSLLLAHHRGEDIEVLCDGKWLMCKPLWVDYCHYRVKPKPVVEIVTNWYVREWGYCSTCEEDATHKITFITVDGIPDCNSIRMVVV